jgi:hypothetical protein
MNWYVWRKRERETDRERVFGGVANREESGPEEKAD